MQGVTSGQPAQLRIRTVMTTFLDAVASAVTPELASVAALAHGAPPEAMERALGGAIHTVLGALAGKVREAPYAAQLHLSLSHSSTDVTPRSVIDSVAGAGGNALLLESGATLVQGLFGQSGDTVAGMIGKMAGLSDGTALLGHAGAMALAIVGARVRAEALDADGLAAALREERELLRKAMPGPVSGMLRISEFVTSSYPTVSSTPPRRSITPLPNTRQAVASPRRALNYRLMLPALAAVSAFALLGWAYLRG